MTERFELLEKIGSGGMGAVWKARDTETNEVVALKLVHPHLAEDPDYIARFEREVEVARRIDSPYVVKVLGYGTREGVPYMAMEYVEGQSLRDLLHANGPMSWDQAKPLVRQIAEALGAAHAVGVIHRDVKPSNILITADGTAKLADFGIARALDLTRLTGSSTMLGTPHYMAPEGTASPQSDMYALGCVTFEMLAGHPPFEGDSQQAVLLKQIFEEPQTSGLPGSAGPLVAWLLAKEPGGRPASAKEFVISLKHGRARLPRNPGSVPAGRIAVAVMTVVAIGAATLFVLTRGGNSSPAVQALVATSRAATGVPTSTATPSRIEDLMRKLSVLDGFDAGVEAARRARGAASATAVATPESTTSVESATPTVPPPAPTQPPVPEQTPSSPTPARYPVPVVSLSIMPNSPGEFCTTNFPGTQNVVWTLMNYPAFPINNVNNTSIRVLSYVTITTKETGRVVSSTGYENRNPITYCIDSTLYQRCSAFSVEDSSGGSVKSETVCSP